MTPSSSRVLQVTGYIYSGSTGHQIGHQSRLGVDGASGSLLHVTRAGAHYILLPCGTSASLSEAMLVSYERCTLERAEYKIRDLPEARRLLRLFQGFELITDRLGRPRRVSCPPLSPPPEAQGGNQLCAPGSRADGHGSPGSNAW